METAFYRRDAPAGNPRPGPNNVGGPAAPDQRAALRPRIGTRGLNNDDLFERDGVEHSYSPLETLVRQTSLKGGWRVKPGASASSTSLGATRATTTTSAGSAGAPAREAAGPPSSSYSANNNPNVVNAAAGSLSMRVQMSAGSSSANTRRTAPTHRALAAASSYLDSYYGLSDANTYVPPDRLQPQNSQNHQNFHAPLTSPLLHTQFRDSTAESSSDIDPLRDSTFYNSDVSPTSSPSANQTAYPRAPSGPPSSNAVPPRGGNLLASNPAGSSHRPSVPPAPLRLPRLTLDDSVIDRDQIQIQWDSDPDSASLFDDPARRSTLTARSGSVSAVRGMGILPPSFTFREEIESPSEEIDGMSFNQGHGRPLSDRSLVLPPSVRNFGIPPPLPRHSSQSNTSPLNPRSPGVESFNSESSFYPSSASPHALTHSPADVPQPLPQTQSDKHVSEPSSIRPSLSNTQSSGPSNTPAAPSQSQSLVNPTLASSAPSSTPVAADVAAAQRRLRTVTMTTVASVSVYDDDGEDGGGGNNNQENNRAGQTSFVDTSFDDDEDYADDYAAADQRPISTLEDTVDLAAVLESSSRAKWKPLALNSPSANGSPLVSPGGGGGGGGFGQQQQQQGTEPESESRDVQRKQQKGGYRQSDLDPFAFRQYEGMRRPSASGGGPRVGDGDTADPSQGNAGASARHNGVPAIVTSLSSPIIEEPASSDFDQPNPAMPSPLSNTPSSSKPPTSTAPTSYRGPNLGSSNSGSLSRAGSSSSLSSTSNPHITTGTVPGLSSRSQSRSQSRARSRAQELSYASTTTSEQGYEYGYETDDNETMSNLSHFSSAVTFPTATVVSTSVSPTDRRNRPGIPTSQSEPVHLSPSSGPSSSSSHSSHRNLNRSPSNSNSNPVMPPSNSLSSSSSGGERGTANIQPPATFVLPPNPNPNPNLSPNPALPDNAGPSAGSSPTSAVSKRAPSQVGGGFNYSRPMRTPVSASSSSSPNVGSPTSFVQSAPSSARIPEREKEFITYNDDPNPSYAGSGGARPPLPSATDNTAYDPSKRALSPQERERQARAQAHLARGLEEKDAGRGGIAGQFVDEQGNWSTRAEIAEGSRPGFGDTDMSGYGDDRDGGRNERERQVYAYANEADQPYGMVYDHTSTHPPASDTLGDMKRQESVPNIHIDDAHVYNPASHETAPSSDPYSDPSLAAYNHFTSTPNSYPTPGNTQPIPPSSSPTSQTQRRYSGESAQTAATGDDSMRYYQALAPKFPVPPSSRGPSPTYRSGPKIMMNGANSNEQSPVTPDRLTPSPAHAMPQSPNASPSRPLNPSELFSSPRSAPHPPNPNPNPSYPPSSAPASRQPAPQPSPAIDPASNLIPPNQSSFSRQPSPTMQYSSPSANTAYARNGSLTNGLSPSSSMSSPAVQSQRSPAPQPVTNVPLGTPISRVNASPDPSSRLAPPGQSAAQNSAGSHVSLYSNYSYYGIPDSPRAGSPRTPESSGKQSPGGAGRGSPSMQKEQDKLLWTPTLLPSQLTPDRMYYQPQFTNAGANMGPGSNTNEHRSFFKRKKSSKESNDGLAVVSRSLMGGSTTNLNQKGYNPTSSANSFGQLSSGSTSPRHGQHLAVPKPGVGPGFGRVPSPDSQDQYQPRTPEQYLQVGITLHEKNELALSAHCFEQAATLNGGCGFGMLMWGLTLRHGWGVRPDEKTGFAWVRQAADAAVGDLEKVVEGVEADAVRSELVLAIFEVGQCYSKGWGVKEDKKLAFGYFQVAARLGDSDAQQELGFCYANGKGCKKDKKEAAKWYRAAAAQGVSTVGMAWIFKEKYDP